MLPTFKIGDRTDDGSILPDIGVVVGNPLLNADDLQRCIISRRYVILHIRSCSSCDGGRIARRGGGGKITGIIGPLDGGKDKLVGGQHGIRRFQRQQTQIVLQSSGNQTGQTLIDAGGDVEAFINQIGLFLNPPIILDVRRGVADRLTGRQGGYTAVDGHGSQVGIGKDLYIEAQNGYRAIGGDVGNAVGSRHDKFRIKIVAVLAEMQLRLHVGQGLITDVLHLHSHWDVELPTTHVRDCTIHPIDDNGADLNRIAGLADS